MPACAVSGDIRQQTRDTLDGIDATLKQAGSSLANAASLTVYLTSLADVPAMNEVYATYFKSAPPARTTVIVMQPLALPTGLVEISAVGIPSGAERAVVHPEGWAKVPDRDGLVADHPEVLRHEHDRDGQRRGDTQGGGHGVR